MNERTLKLIDEVNAEAKPSLTYGDMMRKSRLAQGVERKNPEMVFELGGVPIFTKKGISTLIGKAKAGKTTCTAWIAAQALLNGLTVGWVDTEQGEYYGGRTQDWVLSIAGLSTCDRLLYYDLSEFGPVDRTGIINEVVNTEHPDFIIIDGIKDLVFDINSPVEATNMATQVMQWSKAHNCHVLCIIHQNKGNESARGHLGTEMINKSETVLKVSKDESTQQTICEAEFTRNATFEPFAFERDTHGIPHLVDFINPATNSNTNRKEALPIDISASVHYECLIKAFGDESRMSYGDLVLAVKAAFQFYGMRMGTDRAKTFVYHYKQNKYLEFEKVGKEVMHWISSNKTRQIITADEGEKAPF